MVGTIPEDKYYVTVQEVIDWLGLGNYYGDTIPTSVQNRIKTYIEFAMGKVDALTATTWNGRRKVCYEWHDITKYKGGWWCVPEETEILAQEGWKRVDEIGVGEKVIGYDMRYDKLVDAEITAYMVNDNYTGNVVKFKHKQDGTCFVVTDTHPLFFVQGRGDKVIKGRLVPPVAMPKWNWKIPRAARYIGKEVEYEVLPDGRKIPIDAWLKFIGLMLTEGSVWKNSITIYQTKQDGVEYVRDVLEACGFNARYRLNKSGGAFVFRDKVVAEYLRNLGIVQSHASLKYIPNKYKELSGELLENLIEAMVIGDGSKDTAYGGVYFTVSKQLADDFQEICIKAGYNAWQDICNWSGTGYGRSILYRVRFNKKGRLFTVRPGYFEFDEVENIKMYSFTVEPGHAFVARQNGRVMILGNFGVGVPIFLTKMDLDPNIGKDGVLSFEVFSGTQYMDWAQTFEPQRMTGYWWVDPQEGIVYINTFVFWQGGKEIRIKYVYGRDDLPANVKELTLLYAARDFLATERFASIVPEGGATLDFGSMIRYLDARIKELENLLMAVHIATTGKVIEEVEYDPTTGNIIVVGKETSA